MKGRKFFLFPLLCQRLWALPEHLETVHGRVQLKETGQRLTLEQTSDRAVLHWEKFSIGPEESVQFTHPSSDSATLNKVRGPFPSLIDGICSANGKVYLVNPEGIVIGPKGKIQTGAFIGSTLEIAEKAFLENKTLQFEGASEKTVLNRGTIEALSADVLLIARDVENDGSVFAKKGSVLLADASKASFGSGSVYVLPEEEGMVFNTGRIEALRTEIRAAGGSAFSLAINHSGVIEAPLAILHAEKEILQSTGQIVAKKEDKGGEIYLLSEDINLMDSCFLNASGKSGGGKIIIGGDVHGSDWDLPLARSVFVGENVRLDASAKRCGDGGRVIVWGDDSNYFYADVSARGGKEGGDGGFVEISSYLGFDYQGKTDALAPRGKAGTLLLDPSDITISTAAGSPLILIPPPAGTYHYCPPGASATLNNTNLQNALATANVRVATECGLGGAGNITWSAGAPVTWTAATTLSLIADRAISLGSDITNTGTGSFTAMNFSANSAGAATGTFTALTVAAGVTVSSAQGAIAMTGRGGPTGSGNVGILVDTGSVVRSTGTGASAATITLTGFSGGTVTGNVGVRVTGASTQVLSADGDINIQGTSTVSAGGGLFNLGVQIASGAEVRSTGMSAATAATITIQGTGGDTPGSVGANIGISLLGTNSLVTSVAGAIDLTGNAGTGNVFNQGIRMDTGGGVSSTGTGASAAPITLTGTGNGVSSANEGIALSAASTFISSADGSITLTGTGGAGTVSHGIGIVTGATINYSGNSAGTVLLTGTGGGASGTGIFIAGSLGIVPTAGSSSSKDATLTGIPAGTGVGLDISDPIGTSGTGIATGTLTLDSDTLTLGAGGEIETTGDIVIQPRSAAISVGLGGAAGTLNLTDAELDLIQAGATSVRFGRTDTTSTLTMDAYSTFSSPVVFYGATVTVDGAVSAGANAATINIGPAGAGTLNLNALVTASTFTVNGADLDDVFNVNVAGQTGTFNGMGGTNTLNAFNVANTWTVTGNNDGTLNRITFNDMQNLIGGTMNDDFTFTGPYRISGSIEGTVGGVNTLTGPDLMTDWTISGVDDSGTIEPMGSSGPTIFMNIEKLTGGSSDDDFTLMGTTRITNLIDGGGGTNTINGPNLMTDWTITGTNAGSFEQAGASGPTLFTRIQKLTGNAAADDFSFMGAGQISVLIDGGGGANTLTGPDLDTDWTVAGTNGGSVFPAGSAGLSPFANIQTLTGGTGADAFAFQNGASITGPLDGGTGGDNTLNYTAYTTSISVSIISNDANGTATVIGGGFSNIQSFIGGSASNPFNGLSSGNTWVISGNDAGTVNTVLSFSRFTILKGGALGPDTFTFTGPYRITGLIDGVADTNTLTGPDVPTVWAIRGSDAGLITPSGSPFSHFGNIQNLFGGGENDVFDYSAGFSTTGTLDGGGGGNGLIGPNLPSLWTITATDQGTLESLGRAFTNIGTLFGGTGADRFLFSDGIGLTGAIQGGGNALANTLDYTEYTTKVLITLSTPTSGTASNLGVGFTNIGNFLGNVTVIPLPPPSPSDPAKTPQGQAFSSTLSAVSLAQISNFNLIVNPNLPNYGSLATLLNWILYPEIDLRPKWKESLREKEE